MSGENSQSGVSRGLRLARAAWLAAAVLAFGLLLASLPGYLRGFQLNGPVDASPELVTVFQWVGSLASLTAALLSLSLAVLLIWRKPFDRMAVFISFYLLAYGIVMGGPLEALSALNGWSSDVTILAQAAFLTTPTIAFLALFPSGQFFPRWTRQLTGASLLVIGSAFTVPVRDWWNLGNPIIAADAVLLALAVIAVIAAQVYRYRRISTGAQRQQTKWVVYGLALWIMYLAFSIIPFSLSQTLPPGAVAAVWALPLSALWWLSLTILPVSLTLGILRRHLFDIDFLIRRTLIYSVLTSLLALFYFGSVVILQWLLRGLSGQSSDLAIILSTLGIAALFVPLRNRIQSAIDRRFYRRKYDAAHVLQAFAATVRDEVDLNRLIEQLTRVVEETMQPEQVSVWLAKPEGQRPGERAHPM